MKAKVECSARHIHLSEEDHYKLTGKYELAKVKDLSISGEYLSDLKLNLYGKFRTLENISVLGPFRNISQIEVSKTDALSLKVDAPLRLSGSVYDSAGCLLGNPDNNKVLLLNRGLIVAKRHIHVPTKFCLEYGFTSGDLAECIFNEHVPSEVIKVRAIVRASDCKFPIIHLDTDEYNGFRMHRFYPDASVYKLF